MGDRMVIWRGKSRIDGTTPIVLIATYANGSGAQSDNRKTGGMVQTWILRDDMEPHDALRNGSDEAICGTCPHRGKASGGSGACYVTVFQAPLSTFRAYKRGNARPLDLSVLAGRSIRFGAYGDPAAVPFHVWESLASVASSVTGYTHAWRYCDPRFARFCMASCDSLEDHAAARSAGYRAFVVRERGSAKPAGMVTCPASDEGGKRTQCADCLQCGGTASGRKADITIMAHGASAAAFVPHPLGSRVPAGV